MKQKKHHRPTYDWSTVDWSQLDRVIAATLGCSVSCAWNHRQDIARGYRFTSRHKLRNADWSLGNAELGRLYGVSRQAALMARYKFAPETVARRVKP